MCKEVYKYWILCNSHISLGIVIIYVNKSTTDYFLFWLKRSVHDNVRQWFSNFQEGDRLKSLIAAMLKLELESQGIDFKDGGSRLGKV